MSLRLCLRHWASENTSGPDRSREESVRTCVCVSVCVCVCVYYSTCAYVSTCASARASTHALCSYEWCIAPDPDTWDIRKLGHYAI
jgi:hypothetical protein